MLPWDAKGLNMKKSSWSEHHAIGAAQPVMTGSASSNTEGGVHFTMECNGVDVPFAINQDVLAILDGKPDGELDVMAIFTRYRARIIGVAVRLLRAGVTSTPVVMHSAYFR
jgi:hypothetical protein